jgi:hypothetical protein
MLIDQSSSKKLPPIADENRYRDPQANIIQRRGARGGERGRERERERERVCSRSSLYIIASSLASLWDS